MLPVLLSADDTAPLPALLKQCYDDYDAVATASELLPSLLQLHYPMDIMNKTYFQGHSETTRETFLAVEIGRSHTTLIPKPDQTLPPPIHYHC